MSHTCRHTLEAAQPKARWRHRSSRRCRMIFQAFFRLLLFPTLFFR